MDTRLKLIAALHGNNVVVATEIKDSRSGSYRREYTCAFTPHVIEPESYQFVEESAYAFLVVIPRWVLRWDRDQPFCKIQHRFFGESFA